MIAALSPANDAQRTLNDAQLALIRNRQALLSYSVDLMNALGGGWAEEDRRIDPVQASK